MQSLILDFDQLRYLTPDLLGLSGSIRQEHHDFQVYELPAYLPSGEGEHMMFLLEKRGKTTKEIFDFIHKDMHINSSHIGVAGLKDKHAITQQWLSIPSRYAGRLIQLEQLEGIQILERGLHGNKLQIGHLKGNRFRLLIRNPQLEHLEQARQAMQRMNQQGVPNYYGPQRFGIRGMNPAMGYRIAKGEKVHTTPWLRKLYTASLQSLLFNHWLDERMRLGWFDTVVVGDVAKKHETGGEFVVRSLEEQPRAASFEISATGALFGKKIRASEGEAHELENQILAQFDLERSHFNARRGDRRMIRFSLGDWSMEACPEGVWVEFNLPKGAYATTVLREIMKNTPQEPEPEELQPQTEPSEVEA